MSTGIGDAIAQEAVKCLSDPSVDATPGMCQHFVRVVCERVGGLAQRVMDEYRRETAAATMTAFEGTNWAVWDGLADYGTVPNLVAGDILYKGRITSGVNGHTAVVFHNLVMGQSVLCVAENSSWQLSHPDHAVQGAKGWRTLHEFGPFELVVRIGD